jgi:hypothetical protein
METTFEFSPKQGQTVNIDFVDGWFLCRFGSWIDTPRATYCTICVCENGKIKNYHAGCVCNPKDQYNQRTGMFIAFRKALRERWDDAHWPFSENVWISYHKMWSHYLAAMMDGKATNNGYIGQI